MKIKSFFDLVEIRTKVASVVPFLLGTLYTIYHYHKINPKNLIIFFISMISFDMVTTTINNYYDYKKSNKKSGYNYENHNPIVNDNLSQKSVQFVIFLLLFIAVISGIILFFNTDIIVLLTGAVCFAVGIFYSFGPLPISRTPTGELFSGFLMGFVILFLSVYINVYDLHLISFSLNNNLFLLEIDYKELSYIFLLSIPCICGIANIMLANNISDMESDLEDKRYTLPVYIGKQKSLFIFTILYCISYIDILALTLLRIMHVYTLLSLLTAIPVIGNIMKFYKQQTKKDTFKLSVMNFLLINVVYIIILTAVIIIPFIFNRNLILNITLLQ